MVTAQQVLDAARSRQLMVATAESCTGGLIAGALTDPAGASDVVDRGFVTYSNVAKIELLGVAPALLEAHGAVSAEVAAAMASGALARSAADLAVAITGIAGPGGGTPAKPVGLVFLAAADRGGRNEVERHHFAGDRAQIRRSSVQAALELLLHRIEAL